MKISYAITVSNEVKEFKTLLDFILSNKREIDQVVILADMSKTQQVPELDDYLSNLTNPDLNIDVRGAKFGGDFAAWKNLLDACCKGDWIFQLDADELPSKELIENLPTILETDAEAIAIPRQNLVEGITDEDIKRWGWRVTDKGINWPDYQWRLYRNKPEIKWVGKVHERPQGFIKYGVIPATQFIYRLDHFKNIERQRAQNDYYNQLIHEQ